MLKAVLFDLDNTLIHYSEREFFEQYVTRLMPVFADIVPPDKLLLLLISSTMGLLNNDGSVPNVQRFMDLFCADCEMHRSEVWRRFIGFYEEEYDRFQSLVTVAEGVRHVFLRLKEDHLKLVIASNPVWPLNVQMKRLSWAGIGDLEFDLITHIENMSYCKPRVQYYQEACAIIGEDPVDCLMVGNDPVNDMVVARIGMKTYMVTDGHSELELSRSIHHHAPGEIPEPDYRGPLADVSNIVSAILAGDVSS
jgi:FMN phosphatase YigB (HAD superfamily)